MPPHEGLVHPKEYDIKDSNVELIGADIDHRVKYKSAATEPAWNDGAVGKTAGLKIWRIENFEVVPWPKQRHGQFYDGDSFIVLHSYKVGKDSDKLGHDIFFWLGAHTTQDEAGTAAYKTVELDEFLNGAATQHREVQQAPSDAFLALFPRIKISAGGVASGFRHVERDGEQVQGQQNVLLRVFTPVGSSVVAHEVEPSWRSLDDGDVFVLDTGDKMWLWQGMRSSPMEKARAAALVHDLTLESKKRIDVEVVAQSESRSRRVIDLLGGDQETPREGFRQPRPLGSGPKEEARSKKQLFRLSDASGQLEFVLVCEGARVPRGQLDGNDVFVLDDGGRAVWVWEGRGASVAERAKWLGVARAYMARVGGEQLVPLAKVKEGSEGGAFWKALEVQ
ncbi:hypothetical protein CDD82_3982 [Ophiocordyceps australis]|uniref:Gelsolin-like domain-containing protein n=1 Tax=Ophiocordyceps australis TaxID=1399860 RepID=A0A2C5Z611_9HYPO|nr:hypothetical protein CDD82_3982 [Ophiocordyceps australis]